MVTIMGDDVVLSQERKKEREWNRLIDNIMIMTVKN